MSTKTTDRRRKGSLADIIERHRGGTAIGIPSLCTAHAAVLQAALQSARAADCPVLIEATSNQVNQFGGYTGMNPAQFAAYVYRIADRANFPRDRLVLGGDHLGPNAWQQESAGIAMEKARRMVGEYASAGFAKIHLDASMRCADDPGDRHTALPEQVVTERAADLCLAAEQASSDSGQTQLPVYVIGTEVPVPGGAQEAETSIAVTSVEAARRTIETARAAFQARGLEEAWSRVIAVVVQPGVEFADEAVFHYVPEAADGLARLIEASEGLVFEAHSTDYQPEAALKALVRDHFAILKVGPQLTFAFREAVFALEMIEQEWLAGRAAPACSNLRATMETAMVGAPANWQRHYHGTNSEQRLARAFSYLDRSRYYWGDATVQAALHRLMANLDGRPLPMTLLSQFMPRQYEAVRAGAIASRPRDLIHYHITQVIDAYVRACSS